MDHHDDQNYLFNIVGTLVRHVYASVNKNLIYSYAQGVSSILTSFTSVTSSLWRNRRFILVIDEEFVLSSQIFTRKEIRDMFIFFFKKKMTPYRDVEWGKNRGISKPFLLLLHI